jgi:hypothetical protein
MATKAPSGIPFSIERLITLTVAQWRRGPKPKFFEDE